MIIFMICLAFALVALADVPRFVIKKDKAGAIKYGILFACTLTLAILAEVYGGAINLTEALNRLVEAMHLKYPI